MTIDYACHRTLGVPDPTPRSAKNVVTPLNLIGSSMRIHRQRNPIRQWLATAYPVTVAPLNAPCAAYPRAQETRIS